MFLQPEQKNKNGSICIFFPGEILFHRITFQVLMYCLVGADNAVEGVCGITGAQEFAWGTVVFLYLSSHSSFLNKWVSGLLHFHLQFSLSQRSYLSRVHVTGVNLHS